MEDSFAQLNGAASQSSLKQRLSMACGIGEAPAGADIYPALYNQHVIDELSLRAEDAETAVVLNEACAGDTDITNRCELSPDPGGGQQLANFEEPYCDLLERQRQLLLRELAG